MHTALRPTCNPEQSLSSTAAHTAASSLGSRRYALKHALIGVLASSALAIAACSPPNQSDSDSSVTSSSGAASPSQGAAQTSQASTEATQKALSFEEAYITAKPADKAMTGVFGTLQNHSDEDIHLTDVTGSLQATYQYHVVEAGNMMQSPEGFTIKAGQSLVLQPGHEHIMIMDAPKEIAAGDSLNLTLTDDQGIHYEFPGIPVRVQQSTHEHYADGTTGGSEGHSAGMSSTMPSNMEMEHHH